MIKAIIPVAGVGTRLRPLTYTQPKPLIPVAGKPILGFIVEQLLESGIEEFVFVIGYLGEKIKNYIQDKYPDLKAEFVHQSERKGLGHAIWLTKELFEEEEAMIVLGDTIFDADLEEMLQYRGSVVGYKKVDDPTEFGIISMNEAQEATNFEEKPLIPKSNLALVGLYKIKETNEMFAALEELISESVDETQEFQFTNGLLKMIQNGVQIKGIPVNNFFDCGKKEVLLETNASLLKKAAFASQELPFYNNTIIIHPVTIAKGTTISNSIIGPNVTIGENTEINYSIVKNSIIGNYSKIEDVLLDSSVVGSDASIKGPSQSLNIGDNTEIDFS